MANGVMKTPSVSTIPLVAGTNVSPPSTDFWIEGNSWY